MNATTSSTTEPRQPLAPDATVVVVGGGHAGVAVLAQLRSQGFAGQLVLISAEIGLPYHRPPLSKMALLEGTDRTSLSLRPEPWYVTNSVTRHVSTRVTHIDRAARRVHLKSSSAPEAIGYDALILATGSAPRPWTDPVNGGGALGVAEGLHVLRDVEDAAALRAAMVGRGHLVIVGGGYIGLEVAATARALGCDVCIVEQAPRVLQRVAPKATSRLMRQLHQSHGVRLFEGAQVVALQREEGKISNVRIRTAEGDLRELKADLVLAGIGTVPRDDLAKDCGLEVGDGVLVNAQGQTQDRAIWAVGDVARHMDQAMRIESVGNAHHQAALVAAAMMARPEPSPFVPWFWSDQYGGRLQIAGLWQSADRWVERHEGGQGHSIWSYLGDRLVAVDAWQAPVAYVSGKKWLETGQYPPPEWLANKDHHIKDWMPQARSSVAP
ncbi:MAG: FAD-dependent oxidoreductase [Hydrogenophaga sp.]|nr:FAD-dependent oxidoreductase [Hydrogenophaga sp.]